MKKVSLFFSFLMASMLSFGQTATVVALDPNGDGGFENATTIAGNGWSIVAPTGSNTWNTSAVPGQFSGARCAFISSNGGASYNYSTGSISRTYMYRDIAIPADATAINLSFYYKTAGENGSTAPNNWDQLLVFHAPGTFTPVNSAPTGTSSTLTGATRIFGSSIQSPVAWAQITATIPVASYAGSTMRLMFLWKNDGGGGTNPPAAVDNIQVTYQVPCTPPAVITGTQAICNGASTTLASLTAGGTWSSGNPAVASISPSGSSVSVTGLAIGTSNITYMVAGCPRVATVSVNPVPTINVTPATMVRCLGVSGKLRAQSQIPGTISYPSGTLGISIPDDNATGINNSQLVSLPSGAVITNASVTLNINHTFMGDITINLKAPNGNTLNLFNQHGGSGNNLTNTVISSAGTTTLASGSVPFTGTFAPAAVNGVGPTSFISNVTNFSGLYSVPNGNWTLALYDDAGSDVGSLVNWTLTISYVIQPAITWTPTSGLFVDSAQTIAYTGTSVSEVFAAPATTTIYTATANQEGCTAIASGLASVNPLPASIDGPASVCAASSITFTNTTGGGTWASLHTDVATVNSSTGVVTGVAAGIATIKYTLSGTGCAVTRNVTVFPESAAVNGSGNVCESATTVLSHPDGGTGTWSSGAPANASVGLTSGIVSGVSAGFATITYTNTNGCIATRQITVNGLPLVSVTPMADTVCPGNSAVVTVASPAPQLSLLSQDFNTSLSGWSVSNGSGVPAVNGWSVVAPPGDGGVTGDGTAYLQAFSQSFASPTNTTVTSPVFATTGGYEVVSLSFNQTLLSFSPDVAASIEYSTDGGNTWGLITNQVAGSPTVINELGAWSASVPQFIVDLPADALNKAAVQIRWVYEAQSLYWTIDNIVVKGRLPVSTVAWTGAPGLACVNCLTNTITPVALGVNNYNVAVTTSAGCVVNTPVLITVETPAAITGAATVCEAGTTTFSNSVPAGSWSSANTGIASVNSTTGEVAGVAAGFTTITYSLPSGCYTTKSIQVVAAPVATGVSAICQGGSAVFTGTTPGAVWSSNAPAIASVNASGVVTASTTNSGVVTINYTLGSTGCSASLPLTVNPAPAITGAAGVCVGSSTTLSTSVSGGTWTSGNTLAATIGATTGVVTGVNAANTTISYTTPAGCVTTRSLAVNALPGVINGTASVCEGGVTSLFVASTAGVWSSSNPAIASIDEAGELTAVATSGTATISYTIVSSGCTRTRAVTVNPLPVFTSTGVTACAGGGTLAMAATPVGGLWSINNLVVASINSSTGLVTGQVQGDATITYSSPAGCVATQVVSVNPLPNSIGGVATVCEGFTTTLTNTTPGGLWSTSDAGVADVDVTTGFVMGNTAGTAVITYTLGSGCYRTRIVTVNNTPTAFSGVLNVCPGQSSLVTTTPAGGIWTSSSASIATVSAVGNVTGITPGNVNISYTLPNGCRRVESFEVKALPAVITGTRKVCVGEVTQLLNTNTSGTWSTTSTIADVDMLNGFVTGNVPGTLTVSYTLPTGCFRTTTVTVNALPQAIAGPAVVCEASLITLTNATTGGTWNSGNATIATIGATTGILTGVADGIVNVSYALPTGCRSTMAVQVNGRPGVINGLSVICKGQQTTLTSTMGGVWSSSDISVVTVDAAGMMTGMGAGNAEVRYTLPTGCYRSHMVTVNPLPAAIVGNISLCQGGVTGLFSATPGGTWSSSNPAVAPVSPVGLVQGAGVGFSIISYTLPTGCARTATMVVNGLPEPITGVGVVCSGNSTQLESVTPGGIWSTNNDVVSISNTGLALGVGAGTSVVSYTNNFGCRRTKVVTVNALPDLITGSATICPGTTATLGNSVAGGTWVSDNTAMLTIGATSGMITAVGADGTANVTYTLPTGCIRATQITVHPAVAPVTGTTTICREGTTTLSNATVGGTWMSGNDAIATVDATTGMVTGVGAGVTSIAYVMPTGCKSVATLIVNGLPANITGAASVCAGSTAMLENAVPGGSWSVADAAMATVNAAGMVTGVAAGETQVVYTLPTGCTTSRGMVVNALPVVQDVTGGGGYCAGGAGVAVGIDTTENNMLYKLMDGTGTVLTMVGNGGALSFGNQTAAGSYSVTAVSLLGCMQAMNGTATVVVNPILTPTVNVLSDMGSSVCAGTTVTYSISSTNGGTTPAYVWKVNGTEVGTAATYSYIPANGDEVSVRLTSSEACAVPAQVGATMTMEVLPVRTPSISIVVGPDDTLCQGGLATFHATAVDGGTAPGYTWHVNGARVHGITSDTYTYEPANNDVVVCRLSSNYACVSTNDVGSNAITMHIDEIYTPIVEMTANPGIAVNAGTTVTFTANPIKAGTAPTFQWLVNDKVIAGATQNTYTTATLSNRDSVTCIVTATDKCSNRSINSIVMTVLTPTGVGTASLGNSDLRLMPNPNAGSFVVTGTLGVKTDEVVMFEVTNMLGQVIYRGSSKAQGGVVDARIDLGQNLANGMYMLNMTAGGDQRSFHFVLKH
jgi:subtilisin-like proprotein convertase family protein/uncharacterized protein YjdB